MENKDAQKNYVDYVCFLGIPTDEIFDLFNTNTPYGGSREEKVKVYGLDAGLSYNKVKVCTYMVVAPIDNV